MYVRRPPALILLICLAVLSLTSCLARRRVITRKGGTAHQALLTASKDDLVRRIAFEYNQINDINATVDMTPALGSTEKNHVTEYKEVRGYILFRKPEEIRIIGLYPVVRNKAFDMVSTGATFRLFLPSSNRFIVGNNEVTSVASSKKIENLRPQHFLEALLVRPLDPAADQAVLENLTDEDQAVYILHFIAHNAKGMDYLTRDVWFDRLNLQMIRQLIFDPAGNILTDARYSEWQNYDNVPFPKHIEINRPRDEYAVVLSVVKMDINKGVSNDKFVLEQPEGSTLEVLGRKSPPPVAKSDRRSPSKEE